MNNKKIKFRIVDDRYSFSKSIIPYYEQDGKVFVAEKVELKFKEYEGGEAVDSGIQVYDDTGFLEELFIALGGEKEKETITNAKLGATERHLEDMRKLVFGKTNKISSMNKEKNDNN